jgi:hypothetical protein
MVCAAQAPLILSRSMAVDIVTVSWLVALIEQTSKPIAISEWYIILALGFSIMLLVKIPVAEKSKVIGLSLT